MQLKSGNPSLGSEMFLDAIFEQAQPSTKKIGEI